MAVHSPSPSDLTEIELFGRGKGKALKLSKYKVNEAILEGKLKQRLALQTTESLAPLNILYINTTTF